MSSSGAKGLKVSQGMLVYGVSPIVCEVGGAKWLVLSQFLCMIVLSVKLSALSFQ